MTRQLTRTTLIAAALTLAGCGGDGSGNAPPLASNDDAEDCTVEPYRSLASEYSGTITLDETARGGPYCEWDIALRIDAEPVSEDRCSLSGETSGSVVQSVIPDEETGIARECRAFETTGLVFPDPAGTSPLVLDVISFGRPVDSGPYFGDPAVIAAYVYPFDGVVPLAGELTVDPVSGDLVPLVSNPVTGRVIGGRLVAE